MKEPVWILPETVFALQERLLSEFGGLSGLREMGFCNPLWLVRNSSIA